VDKYIPENKSSCVLHDVTCLLTEYQEKHYRLGSRQYESFKSLIESIITRMGRDKHAEDLSKLERGRNEIKGQSIRNKINDLKRRIASHIIGTEATIDETLGALASMGTEDNPGFPSCFLEWVYCFAPPSSKLNMKPTIDPDKEKEATKIAGSNRLQDDLVKLYGYESASSFPLPRKNPYWIDEPYNVFGGEYTQKMPLLAKERHRKYLHFTKKPKQPTLSQAIESLASKGYTKIVCDVMDKGVTICGEKPNGPT